MPRNKSLAELQHKARREHAKIHDDALAEFSNAPQRKREATRIGTKHGISGDTIWRHARGVCRSREEAAASRRLLLDVEEDALCDFILTQARRGLAMKVTDITEEANALLRARTGPDACVGKQWARKFMLRRDLKTMWSSPLDKSRANGLNPTAVREWFEVFDEEVVQKGVEPDCIFGFDESGVMRGVQKKQRAVADINASSRQIVQDGSRELLSVGSTIDGMGRYLKPLCVYSAKKFQTAWMDDNPADAR